MPSVTNRRRGKHVAPATNKWSESESDDNEYRSFVDALANVDQDKLDTNEIDFRLSTFKQRG